MMLDYTFSNEDSYTEQNILKWRASHVLAIAGSGSRVTPLFAKFPKKITCLDQSKPQLYLTEMRIEALRQLNHADYCQLFGYINTSPDNRKLLFNKLKLSDESKAFLIGYHEKIDWRGLLFTGQWEKNFVNSVKMFQLFFPSLSSVIRECETLEQQKAIYAEFKNAFRLVKYLLFLSTMITVLIKKLSLQKTHLLFTSPFVFSRMFEHSLKHAFSNFLVKNSFYYSVLITGQYTTKLAPTSEVDEKQYIRLQEGARQCDVSYVNRDLVDHCKQVKNEYDFISLSNVPDYIKNSGSLNFLHTIQTAFDNKALLVFRRSITSNKAVLSLNFDQVTEKYRYAINQDTTPFYQIFVYKKRA